MQTPVTSIIVTRNGIIALVAMIPQGAPQCPKKNMSNQRVTAVVEMERERESWGGGGLKDKDPCLSGGVLEVVDNMLL